MGIVARHAGIMSLRVIAEQQLAPAAAPQGQYYSSW
jgi:hypothetical protein